MKEVIFDNSLHEAQFEINGANIFGFSILSDKFDKISCNQVAKVNRNCWL